MRPKECGKKYKIHAERSEAGKFFEKIKNKGPKIHYFALKFTVGPPNCITGASKSWGQGGARVPGAPLDPLVIYE